MHPDFLKKLIVIHHLSIPSSTPLLNVSLALACEAIIVNCILVLGSEYSEKFCSALIFRNIKETISVYPNDCAHTHYTVSVLGVTTKC